MKAKVIKPKVLSTGQEVNEVLRVWRSLEAVVMTLGEADLLTLLEAEKAGGGRKVFLQRIFGRHAKVRASRETAEMRAAVKHG